VTRLLLLLTLAEVVLPLLLLMGCNRLLFFPADRPLPEEELAAIGDANARVVRVARPDGRSLAAYDVVPRDAAADVPVVLFLHGNAGNIAQRAWIAGHFARTAGVRVLMPDYSGYGGNDGSPSEDEINTDALAAYDHLVADGVPASRIVVFGESIGGAPALYVATERRVAGVAVQSTFSSLSSMALHVYWWMPLCALVVTGRFPNADRIATLDVPVLIVHGRSDRVVPFTEGERLAAAQPKAEFLRFEGADHNDLFDVTGDDYLRGLGDRFRRWTGR
jgi:pimeloyl-ACP methyl ester carboxylesterase